MDNTFQREVLYKEERSGILEHSQRNRKKDVRGHSIVRCVLNQVAEDEVVFFFNSRVCEFYATIC